MGVWNIKFLRIILDFIRIRGNRKMSINLLVRIFRNPRHTLQNSAL